MTKDGSDPMPDLEEEKEGFEMPTPEEIRQLMSEVINKQIYRLKKKEKTKEIPTDIPKEENYSFKSKSFFGYKFSGLKKMQYQKTASVSMPYELH